MQTSQFFPLFIVMTALFFSCSQAKPEILLGSLQLVYYENDDVPVEYFSFFILPSDNDGLDDLDELWLYHDWEGLSWQLGSDDWIKETISDQVWIGTRSITMDDGSPLPRGQYRAIIIDKGGDRSEKKITFDAPVRTEFPGFSVKNGNYTIESEYSQHNLVAYDNEGNYIITVTPPSKEGNITALGLPSHVRSVSLWSFDPEQGVSAFTDAVPVELTPGENTGQNTETSENND